MKISDAIFRLRLKLLPKQSHPLAVAAVKGLTAKGFETAPSMCQKFARQCWQLAYGNVYDGAAKGTAALAAEEWAEMGYDVPLERGSIEGDLLYRLSGNGGFGHVGIRLRGNMVAENSVVHGGDGDARGIRTIREFGDWDMVVRLPSGSNMAGKVPQKA